jgi:hypothetical protein
MLLDLPEVLYKASEIPEIQTYINLYNSVNSNENRKHKHHLGPNSFLRQFWPREKEAICIHP